MRKIIFAFLLMLVIALIIFSMSELESIVETLKQSDWHFLVAALLVELIWMYNLAITYRSMYRLLAIKEDSNRLMLVATAANFVNVVAPSAGLGGMAVFMDDARRRNHAIGHVMVVGVLFVLFNYAAFLCVLALGLIVLFRRNNLNAGELTATGILLLIATGVAVLFYLGSRSASELGRVLAWLARLINRILRPFIRRNFIQEERAHSFAVEMADGINIIRRKPRGLIWSFLFSLNNFALQICVLALTFLAMGTPFSVGTLVGGFSIFYLFLIVSPTPSGLGVVEGVMPIALNTLRIKCEAAVLITLVYRALTFWFPLGVGAAAFRLLEGKPKEKAQIESHLEE
jgi:glycosyltransferase 2 family protein